jgi:hypothetical protein
MSNRCTAFLPIFRMLSGVVEYEEANGLLVTERWQDRNRRATATLSPVLIHFLSPLVFSTASSNNFSDKIKLMDVISLRQSQNGTPVLPNLDMRFLLKNGRRSYAVSSRIRNRYARSLTITGCPTKRSGEPFVLLVSGVKQDKAFYYCLSLRDVHCCSKPASVSFNKSKSGDKPDVECTAQYLRRSFGVLQRFSTVIYELISFYKRLSKRFAELRLFFLKSLNGLIQIISVPFLTT